MSAFIEVKDLTIQMGDATLIQGINFDIKENESLGLLGESGAGKSTLLLALRGLEDYTPAKGEIIFHTKICTNPDCYWINPPSYDGICPKCKSPMEPKTINFWHPDMKPYRNPLRRRIAILLQNPYGLFSFNTVIENVILALQSVRYPVEFRVRRAAEIISSVGLSHRITHTARDLSGGEKQRVNLARQIAIDPMLFLLDEPTGTQDPTTAKRTYNLLIDMAQRKRVTMVVASHLYQHSTRLAPRSLLLDNGKLISQGETEKLIEKFHVDAPPTNAIEKSASDLGPSIIDCKDVKKYYYSVDRGIIKAVDGVNISIREREIFGILGRSGAGKTTLSYIISAHPAITEFKGDCLVRIGDDFIDMGKRGPEERGRAKKYISMCYQEYGLFWNKNLFENLRGAIPDVPDEMAEAKIKELLLILGFTEKQAEILPTRMPDELSEGERQRIMIALALIKEPRIVLLDEPTGTMDPLTMVPVAQAIKNARDQLGTTFLIVSHDIDFVKHICDEVTVMKDGKTIFTGLPEEAINAAISKDAV